MTGLMKKNKKIEIVTTEIGGFKLMPAKTVKLLYDALNKNYSDVCVSYINIEQDLVDLVERKPDLIISGIKYLGFSAESIKREFKNKIWFSDYLESYNISYTGSAKPSLELEFDKTLAKSRVAEKGCNTAPFFISNPSICSASTVPLAFPLFIKPRYEGDSRGIDENSLVTTINQYKSKVCSIFTEHHTDSIVEQYLGGSEYTVGIIQDFENDVLKVYPVQLHPEKNIKGDRILGFTDKIADNEGVSYIIDLSIKTAVEKLAIDSFKALGAKGYGRIDIKMDNNNVPFFIEANLIPGLGLGYFYRCYNINTGCSYENMIVNIVENAFYKEVLN